MIKAQAIVDQFRMFLADGWGYIWGATGIQWTESRQKQKVNYMISKYGTGWQNNSEAKDDDYYSAALYGSKWIGHMVCDCAGAFVAAFRALGGTIHSGSNLIWNNDCSSKGQLKRGVRTDGKELLPGTAVFTGDASNHGHIGCYVGGGKVIEASGTKAGVIESDITNSKWTWWGELKNVEYDAQPAPAPAPDPQPGPDPQPQPEPDTKPTLRKGDKGQYVMQAQMLLIQRGYRLPKYGCDGSFGNETLEAVKAFQRDNGLNADGVIGPKTWAALIDSKPDGSLYTVHIPYMTQPQAQALIEKYSGSWMTKAE